LSHQRQTSGANSHDNDWQLVQASGDCPADKKKFLRRDFILSQEIGKTSVETSFKGMHAVRIFWCMNSKTESKAHLQNN
jgi:hypothetical protein